ncbi:MAG TPA: phosphatase PAP2 family protein [Acetobacteraceae bacterium]|nr:phosphatase PAP2 family protein [Acetobacteraceae bacterium]
MNFLTNLADEAVILPLTAGIGVMLLALGWRRGAIAWLVAVVSTLALMFVLKLLGFACGPSLLRAPSGHTAVAAVICGGLVAILARGERRLTLPIALLAAAVIGISRLALGAHSLPEVILGGAVGVGGAVLLARLAGRPPDRSRAAWVVGVVAVVLVIFHGERLPAETRIHSLAYVMAQDLHICRGAPGWGWDQSDQERPYVSSSRTISSSPR